MLRQIFSRADGCQTTPPIAPTDVFHSQSNRANTVLNKRATTRLSADPRRVCACVERAFAGAAGNGAFARRAIPPHAANSSRKSYPRKSYFHPANDDWIDGP